MSSLSLSLSHIMNMSTYSNNQPCFETPSDFLIWRGFSDSWTFWRSSLCKKLRMWAHHGRNLCWGLAEDDYSHLWWSSICLGCCKCLPGCFSWLETSWAWDAKVASPTVRHSNTSICPRTFSLRLGPVAEVGMTAAGLPKRSSDHKSTKITSFIFCHSFGILKMWNLRVGRCCGLSGVEFVDVRSGRWTLRDPCEIPLSFGYSPK